MSMNSWTDDGYGYALFNGNNLDKVKQFILDNREAFAEARPVYKDTVSIFSSDPEVAKENIDAFLEAEDEYEAAEYTSDFLAFIVSEIINVREDLCAFAGYDSCGETEQKQMIGVAPKFAWDINEKNNLTKEQVNDILMKYAGPLGIESAPNYFEAEYFG